MSAERLIKEFEAQDVGAWLTVFRGGVHTRVAKWIEGNQVWELLPDGLALLAEAATPAPEAAEVVEAAPVAPKSHKRKSSVILDDEPETA